MSNIVPVDGHAAVVSAEERDARLRIIRQEGAQLMSLYQSIEDKAVRASVFALVASISKASSGAPSDLSSKT